MSPFYKMKKDALSKLNKTVQLNFKDGDGDIQILSLKYATSNDEGPTPPKMKEKTLEEMPRSEWDDADDLPEVDDDDEANLCNKKINTGKVTTSFMKQNKEVRAVFAKGLYGEELPIELSGFGIGRGSWSSALVRSG